MTGRPDCSISNPTTPTKLLASNHPTVITFSKRQTQISIKSWAVTPKSIPMNPNKCVKYAIKLETWICKYARLVKVTFCGPQGVRFYSSTSVRFWKNSVSLWYTVWLGWRNYGPTVCTSTGPSTCSSRATCPRRHFKWDKSLLTLPLVKPRQNAEATLKTYDLLIYDDKHYILLHFVKICCE